MHRTLMVALAVALGGCTSVGASAVRTGARPLPPRTGPVAIYTAASPPAGIDLGVIEVHGSQTEGVLEELLPVFVEKVAELGGDAAVIDDVRARFDVVAQAEPFGIPCGFAHTCPAGSFGPTGNEVLTVVMRGRAVQTAPAAPIARIGPPGGSP